MGARVYDPYTGTFTQADPIQGGGANAYGYTNGDPVNMTDLNGQRGSYGNGCATSSDPAKCVETTRHGLALMAREGTVRNFVYLA
jgi:uncharacterized protein RhaS with RHS repeats